ncbi:unnamed protein product [Echinostoma caproni]|uniref:THUMP domain-containing protein n=1 Tax=Echinostoma caproni TaxID=27848 RepID=A0A183AUC9_9TREM|nr:unnamed protein product [Echinostoma caproni]
MRGDADKRKRKAYYRKCAASSKRAHMDCGVGPKQSNIPKHLQPGMTGYLVTCNQHERFATMEIFRLLNDALKRVCPESRSASDCESTVKNNTVPMEASDLTVSSSVPVDDRTDITNKSDDSDDGDILKQLRQENASVGADPTVTNSMRHSFYAARSGVSNCLFITHFAESAVPNELVHSIFEHMLRNQVVESRHVLRVLPVAATCHASGPELSRCVRVLWASFIGHLVNQVKSINTEKKEQSEQTESEETTSKSDGELLEKLKPPINPSDSSVHPLCPRVGLPRARQETLDGPKTFLVSFKARNYDRLSRDTAIESTVSAVRGLDSSWRICPADPSVMIFVNVLRNVACVSLLEDFNRFRKYNLAELIPPVASKPSTESDLCTEEKQCEPSPA